MIPRAEVVTYETVHARLRKVHGLARDKQCVGCGKPARQWAYQGGDPDERLGGQFNSPYSHDASRYAPMCVSCHRLLDNPIRRGHSPDVCINGHLWAENEGVRRVHQRKGRYCIACNREADARYRARKRAERKAAA